MALLHTHESRLFLSSMKVFPTDQDFQVSQVRRSRSIDHEETIPDSTQSAISMVHVCSVLDIFDFESTHLGLTMA
jgi:hypothetical protein